MLPPCSWRLEYNTSSAACRQHSGNAPAWPCIEGGHVLRLSAPIVVTLLLSWERFLCLLSLITVTEDGPDRQPAAWITSSIFPSAQRSFDDNKRHTNTIMMAMKALFCIQIPFFRLAYAHWLGQKPDGPHNNYGLPEATATSSPDDIKGWSPKPTEPPLPNHGPDISFIELMRRSEHWIKAKRQTTQYLNSKTCGYFPSDECKLSSVYPSPRASLTKPLFQLTPGYAPTQKHAPPTPTTSLRASPQARQGHSSASVSTTQPTSRVYATIGAQTTPKLGAGKSGAFTSRMTSSS